MKYCVFLLLICFFPIIFCLGDANLTDDDDCPDSQSRRKRRYTRWNDGQDESPEFIVKVIDEDLAPNVPAINLPLPHKEEKIIVGGVIVPSPTTALTDALDYTRFMPPTSKNAIVEVYPVTGTPDPDPSFVRPTHPKVKGVIKKKPLKHVAANRERDESPPMSPQFVARTASIIAQYAPIAPVAFSQHASLTPLTPPHGPFPPRTTLKYATRTMSPIINKPTKTWSAVEAFKSYEEKQSYPTHSSYYQPDLIPTRTSFQTTNEDHDRSFGENRQTYQSKESSYSVLYEDENDKLYLEKDTETSENKYNDGNESYLQSIDDEIASNNKTEAVDIEVESTSSNSDHVSSRIRENNSEKKIGLQKLPPIQRRKENAPMCDLTKLRRLSFKSPRTLFEIVTQLKRWAEESPVAKLIDITEGNFTVLENPIYMMVIDDPSSGQILSAKQTVMIVAGIQGRDHHAVTAAMFVLHQLIEQTETHEDLLVKYRFWVIPVFNPDGYEYSMTFPHRREWTRNLRQSWEECKGRDFCSKCESYGLRCTIHNCYGVNLDRNFEYQWIPTDELQSEHQCGSLYAGKRQLSEAETIALTHYLLEKRMTVAFFIAFKEGDVLGILYPYSHTKKKRTYDKVSKLKASLAGSAAYEVKGRPYVTGQTSEFLPLYAGGIEDWMEGHLGIDDTYTIMMFRPTDIYDSKKNTMEAVIHEAFAAMDALLQHTSNTLVPTNVMLTKTAYHLRPSVTLTTYFVLITLTT